MTSALFISIALQLSVVLLFRKLSRSMKRPKLWTTVALLLMTIPFSAAVYQLMETHRTHIPLPELLSFMGSFLATLAFLGLVPTAYLLIRSREGQVHEDQCVLAGRDCPAQTG